MKHLDKEDRKELERLKNLVTGKRLNLPNEQLTSREATALLRYIDTLEAKIQGNEATDELEYSEDDLNSALRKLVGMAATSSSKTDQHSSS